MGDGVRVILPVLQRPERAALVLDSLKRSEGVTPLRALFMLTADDKEEYEAVRMTGADYLVVGRRQPGDYARKINVGAAQTLEPWIFTGADDLAFHPGWADEAISFAETNQLRVVGCNDLGRWAIRRRKLSPTPHFLVHRSYLASGTADEAGKLFHEGYDHNFVDNEFAMTAVARGEYAYCAEAVVEHLHPFWRKGVKDEVYRMGRLYNREDLALYLQREQLWT